MFDKICRSCLSHYQSARGASVYCSSQCAGAAKKNGATVPCAQCGVSVYVQPSRSKNSEKIFCSKSCHTTNINLSDKNPSYKRDISGDKNPMFGRGLSGKDNPMYGKTGELCPHWKGGLKKRKDGYILVHLQAHHSLRNGKPGYVLAHRLAMELHLGRNLTNDEVVHHLNEDPSDNRIENLAIMTQSEHARLHFAKTNEDC